MYEYSASSASSDRRPFVENQPEPSVENDTPRWSRERRRQDWLHAVRRRATDVLYEVIDAGFRIAAKFGRPSVTHRTTEETRSR